ncbi:MAG: glycerate kinase [Nitriliruptorales bacterium]|nr:glycerate kinase [Nitriliruptorales bacterium]
MRHPAGSGFPLPTIAGVRVLIAPDKFAGTMSAADAAAAMARGWVGQRRGDDVVCRPMADGGEGTIDVVAAGAGGRRRRLPVADARGYAVTAEWLRLPDGRALIESAQACGLHLVPADQRDPRLTTTFGVGQLIRAAAAEGAHEIIVGLGGSATVDGGAGMATALGHRLLREDGNGVKVGGGFLTALHRVVPVPAPDVPVVVAVDVHGPLLGPDGAVAGFAAQKGAGPDALPVLETSLRTLADVTERDVDGGPWRDLPGAGAAGGLGFGLAAFAGGRLVSGAPLVAELVRLAEAAAVADVVVTGEGRLDRWSLRGKVPGEVCDHARRHGARAVAIVGSAADDVAGAFDAVEELGEAGLRDPVGTVEAGAAALAAAITG